MKEKQKEFITFFRKVIFGLLLYLPLFSSSQSPFFEDVIFTYRNNPVKTNRVFKDSDGWIYLGTDHGLFRYDGIVFGKIHGDDSITENTVTAIYQSSDRKIWVGFMDGTIATYFKGKLRIFQPQEGLPKVSITCFAENKEHMIWIGTNGEGVYCTANNHLYNINTDDGLNDNFVHAIYGTTNDDLVIAASDHGLNECVFSAGKKSVFSRYPTNTLPDNIITSLSAIDSALIIGTQDKGICKIDFPYSKGKIELPELSSNWKYGMVNKVIAVGNEIWIASDNNGLVIADAATGKFKFNIKNTAYFQHTKINDLVSDNEGNVWIACSDGLVKSTGKKMRFMEGLPDEKISFIHTILIDSKGNCWFTPDQGLVKLWQDDAGSSLSQKFTLTPPERLIDIVALYEDPYGYLWIGTMGEGVYRLHIESGRVRKVTENISLLNGSILTISGKGNDVWIGGFGGTAHCSIESGANDTESLKFINDIATDSLRNSYIYCIYTDKENRTWFGTEGEGVYVFDGRELKNLSSTGFNVGTIYSILEDEIGNIWFNTHDKGIYMFNGKLFKNYSLSDGLSDITVSSMIFDQRGNLLLVHKNGVDILNKGENRFSYLGNNRLLTNMNPDLNSATVNGAGDVFIGTEKFILQLSTDELKKQPFPKTFLENIFIFQNETSDTIHSFSSDQNNFSFSFTGLWYSNPSLVQYQYKLDGFNDEWINTTDREINFPKLTSGSYTFSVRSSLNNDFTNASEASYHFRINPPFWKTIWFQVLITLLVASLLYAFIRWRDRRIRKMDLLRKESVEFQFEILKSQVNPHFLFNSFNTLISIIEEDQKTAVSYVEKLSEFFRSIIAYRDKNLIPLREEINLLQNYFFLQKKRYGQHLTLRIDIFESALDSFEIPPLTLQLLMENALKHNAVSKETPMVVELSMGNNGKLMVQNNINPKMMTGKSSGLGLQNITSRFKLLTDEKIEVLNDGKKFVVIIPLIKKQ